MWSPTGRHTEAEGRQRVSVLSSTDLRVLNRDEASSEQREDEREGEAERDGGQRWGRGAEAGGRTSIKFAPLSDKKLIRPTLCI
jgi:hypothetical protein